MLEDIVLLLSQVWGRWQRFLVIARGKKSNTLYSLEGQIEVGVAMVVVDRKKNIWHKRLGHMRKKGLEISQEEPNSKFEINRFGVMWALHAWQEKKDKILYQGTWEGVMIVGISSFKCPWPFWGTIYWWVKLFCYFFKRLNYKGLGLYVKKKV